MVRKTKYFHNVKAITPWNKSLVTIALKNTNLHENRDSQEADRKQALDFVDARKIYILGVVFTDYSQFKKQLGVPGKIKLILGKTYIVIINYFDI